MVPLNNVNIFITLHFDYIHSILYVCVGVMY
jgi:hypothetical protein